jgi:DNA-binding XRE family transcriptional regulator
MRQHIKIPRILKINWVNKLEISVVFNNGVSRVIDFEEVFLKTGIDQSWPAAILLNASEFSKVKLNNNTLSWDNVEQFITLKNGEKEQVPFEIGADVLFQFSHPEKVDISKKIGHLIRDFRRKSGLTQEQLAVKSGTSRNYISRIENDRSDIELSTLRKIIETGFGKQLELRIK